MAVDLSQIIVNVEDIDLGDVEILSDQSGQFTTTQRLEVLGRVVTGVDPRKIGVLQTNDVMNLITAALEVRQNPTSAKA